MINSIKEKPYSIIYFIQSPHAQFAEGLCSYIIKKNHEVFFFFPRKVKDLHQGLPLKRNTSSPASERKDSGRYRVSLLCSPTCLVLATGKAKRASMISTLTDSRCQQPSSGLALGRRRLIPLGLVEEKWLTSFDHQSSVLIRFPVLLTTSVLSKAGELASEQPMQGSKFHS